jgi:tetratricopeptide (TPR) repeat protein
MRASGWLVFTFFYLPVPADTAIERAEQLLHEASGDPWAEAQILQPLSVLYAYAGRFPDARAAVARARATFASSGAKFDWALTAAIPAAEVELISGDLAAAEGHLREGCAALRQMGERGYLSSALGKLAETVYRQARLDEAQQLTEEAEALAPADDYDAQTRWRATRAKLLARRGQFPAARQLAEEAVALVSGTSDAVMLAETLMAQAEVNRLAGAAGEVSAGLRAALRIYQDRKAVPLAAQAKAALASLTEQPDTSPA